MASTARFPRQLLLSLALPALMPVGLSAQATPDFAHQAFARVWERTDAPVASGAARRAWFWGPQPNSGGMQEEYREGAGGRRLVQYFDKSRMEINDLNADPAGPFYVTNGLLTVELISGRMQTGNGSFVNRQPSSSPVTGDPGDPLAPTYADLAGVSNAGRDSRDPDRTGQPATATLGRGGTRGNDPSKAAVPGVKIAYYEKITGHNVPQAMWDFLNSTGPTNCRGESCRAPAAQERLAEPWFYASGLPISDPYWVRATISGRPTDVLVQAYERRVLTYVPGNPEGFKVEMGNIGSHYYQWRYGNQAEPSPAPPVVSTLPRFSIDVIGDFTPLTLDMVKSAGAGGVRMYFSWKTLEPDNLSPDKYNWAAYDGAFRAMSSRGLQAIALVHGCPVWACSRPEGPIRGERVGDFVEFMSAVAARYGKAPYNVHHWEFWNEPDSTSTGDIKYNWGTYGARYAAMLKAVRPGMKAADPQAQLIMGGVAYDNFQETGGPFVRRFVDDVLDAGGGQYIDVFNFHYYVQNIHWCSYTAKLNELRGKLKARNLSIPIISTETGFTSDGNFGSNDDMQSLYVAQSYAQSLGEGMLSTTWFLIKDFPSEVTGWGIFQKSGLLDVSGRPKPSHLAYRTAVEQIGQRPARRALGATEGLTGKMRGYEFSPDPEHAGPLWVLWAWDLSTHGPCGAAPALSDFTVQAGSAPNFKRALNIYGQPVPTRTRADGSIAFSLDARPVYIEWNR